jgi:hypothetical protein
MKSYNDAPPKQSPNSLPSASTAAGPKSLTNSSKISLHFYASIPPKRPNSTPTKTSQNLSSHSNAKKKNAIQKMSLPLLKLRQRPASNERGRSPPSRNLLPLTAPICSPRSRDSRSACPLLPSRGLRRDSRRMCKWKRRLLDRVSLMSFRLCGRYCRDYIRVSWNSYGRCMSMLSLLCSVGIPLYALLLPGVSRRCVRLIWWRG